MIFTPNKGKEVNIKGSKAQCIAHASEAAIPNPSQFNFTFIRVAKINDLQYCCKF